MRKLKKLSQEQVALELDLSKTALINWENNKSKPSIDNLMKICNFYETDVYSLLEDVTNVNFSNNHFKKNTNIKLNENCLLNSITSSEIFELILKNQMKINILCEQQSKLFDKLSNI